MKSSQNKTTLVKLDQLEKAKNKNDKKVMGLKQGLVDFVETNHFNTPGLNSAMEHSAFEKTSNFLYGNLKKAGHSVSDLFFDLKENVGNFFSDTQSFFSKLFTKEAVDQQSQIDSSQINNSLLNLEIRTEGFLSNEDTTQIPKKSLISFFKILLLTLMFLIFGNRAYADSCWMIGGCQDAVGYIHISSNIYDTKSYRYTNPCNNKVLKQDVFPVVGSIIWSENPVIFFENIEQIKNAQSIAINDANYLKEKDIRKKECYRTSEIFMDNKSGKPANFKLKLQILSYIKLENDLFALIKVIEEKSY